MANDIRISVIIAVYNAAPFLHQCLDTLCAQSLDNWELICVDDGSTDDSLSILQKYNEKLPHMTILPQENQGAGLARNHGMDAATGKYLLFLDADDYFSPDLLEKMWQGAKSNNADITICRSQCFDHASGKLLPSEWLRKDNYLKGKTTFSPQEVAPYLFQFTYGWAWDKLFLREFVLENQLRFPSLRNSEDLVFVYPALACATKIVVVPTTLIHYRMNRPSSVSGSVKKSAATPWRAVELFKSILCQRELYATYERSFLKWAMDFSIWNVCHLTPHQLQKQEYHRLKREIFSKYNFQQHSAKYYENSTAYYKFRLIRSVPFWLFKLVLECYNWLKCIYVRKKSVHIGGLLC